MTIAGKVAAILNEREIIFNKGSESGVEEGMIFLVTTPDLPVLDPDTGEELGVFNRDKIGVKAAEVHPRFCIGRTYETYVVKDPRSQRDFTKFRTLRLGGVSTIEPMTEEDSFVKIGDRVIQVEPAPEPSQSHKEG